MKKLMVVFKVLLLSSLVFSSSNGIAQEQSDNDMTKQQTDKILQRLRDLQTKQTELNAAISATEKAQKTQQENITSIQKKHQVAATIAEEYRGKGKDAGKGWPEKNEEEELARLSVDRVGNAIKGYAEKNQASKRELETIGDEIAKIEGELTKPERRAEVQVAHLRGEVTSLKIDKRIDLLKDNNANAAKILAEIETEVSQTGVAPYLRDKMGQFMNSDLFCTAVNRRCKTDQTEKYQIPDSEVNKLFPELEHLKQRKSYYEKTHKGQKPMKNTDGSKVQ